MSKATDKRLRKVQAQQARAAEKRAKMGARPLDKLSGKIPDGLSDKLNAAFYKSFGIIFEKGTGLIEKTYDKKEVAREYRYRDGAVREKATQKHLRAVGRRARTTVRWGTGTALAEGAALGVLGIGLPDIPVFLAGLLRGLYRIALSFGFACESEGERCYLLLLIAAALSQTDEREQLQELAAQTARALDAGRPQAAALEDCLRAASDRLSREMLTAKFVQSLPVVGVAGGLRNVSVYRTVTAYAARAYEERYLKKQMGERRRG